MQIAFAPRMIQFAICNVHFAICNPARHRLCKTAPETWRLPSRNWNSWAGPFLVLGACLVAACSPASPKVVPVSGRVTHKGQPLAGATVTFQPARRNSSDAVGSVGAHQCRGTIRVAAGRAGRAWCGRRPAPGDDQHGDGGARGRRRPAQRRACGEVAGATAPQSFVVPQGGTERADFEIE